MFGADFFAAYVPLLALLPCGSDGSAAVLQRPSAACRTAGLIAGIYALRLLCNVLLNIWWIPRWGLVGASAASSVSYSLATLLFVGWTARLADVSVLRALVPDRHDWDIIVAGAHQLRLRARPGRGGRGLPLP